MSRQEVARNKVILDLWNRGYLSYGEIARKVGCTRSVVAGVLYRWASKLPPAERERRKAEALYKPGNRSKS